MNLIKAYKKISDINYCRRFSFIIYVDQNPLTLSRPPVTHLPARDGVATAAARIAAFICAADAPGCVDAYKAQAPVTCGVAIDVPL